MPGDELPMTTIKPHKPFSMIREFHLADWFTLANAVCGIGALFSTMTYLETGDVRHVYFGCGLVIAALIFDVLDGRIARWRQKTSTMGRELDSLADVISFGVAPAIMAYGCGMQGLYDRIVLGYFVACGVSRLARYNVTAEALSEGTGKVKYFEGTPIPTSILLVLLLALAAWLAQCARTCGSAKSAARLHASSARPPLCALGLADDQPHPDPQAVSRRISHRGDRGARQPVRMRPRETAQTDGHSRDALERMRAARFEADARARHQILDRVRNENLARAAPALRRGRPCAPRFRRRRRR